MGYSYHQRAQNFGLNLNIYGPLGCDINLSQLQDFFVLERLNLSTIWVGALRIRVRWSTISMICHWLNIVWRTKRMNALAVRALCPQAQKFKQMKVQSLTTCFAIFIPIKLM